MGPVDRDKIGYDDRMLPDFIPGYFAFLDNIIIEFNKMYGKVSRIKMLSLDMK